MKTWGFTFLLVLLVRQSFAIITGQALVDEARTWIGWPYIWGDPPNRTYFGQKGFDGLYWYGTLFDMENWHGGFDCSGLVSYCAGLRRHYAADMDSLFGVGRPFWEVAQPGDIIRRPKQNNIPGHFRILSINKPDSQKVYFIHAPGTGLTVREESKEYRQLEQMNEHAYIFCDDYTGPEIIVTGVEDGGVYSPPVNFNYLVNDPNEGAKDVFYEGNYPKETKLTQTGDYTLRIFAKDWAMNQSNKTIHFKIVGPPQVISTDPSDGASGVDIYKKIEITFNKPMDTVSVCQALKMVNVDNDSSPVEIKNIYWYDDRTILVRCYDPVVVDDTTGLQYNKNYQVKILGTAADTSGTTLDGDKDGKSEGSPEDDYVFNFKTRKPEAEFAMVPPHFTHPVESCNPPDSVLVSDICNAQITNKEKYRGFLIKFSAEGFGDGSYSWIAESLILRPDTTITAPVVEIRYRSSYTINITVEAFPSPGKDDNDSALFRDTKPVDGVVIWEKPQCCPGSPDCDLPDDNYSITDPHYPTPWYIDTESDIGILLNGFSAGMGHLLGRFKISTALVNTNLRILGSYNSIDSLKVLIIPSGGLFGLENNYLFKQKVLNFAQGGGTVVCFSQQRGYEFSSIFDSTSGYGWQEDYSCQGQSAVLSTWHPVLAGQRNLITSVPIDGFLTSTPSGSQILMMRRTTGMPELVIYPYGHGQVVLTGSYVDFGYGQGQWTNEAVNLVRDIVTWALDTKRPIPEYYAGEQMSLNIPIYYEPNDDTIPANRVRIKILTPNRDSLETIDFPLSPSLRPGDSTIVNLTYNAPTMLGIYPVDYILYNDTSLLQKEKLGKLFAVKTDIPIGNYHFGDYAIWSIVDRDRIILGDTVNFKIFIKNNTNDSLNSKIIFLSHFGVGFYPIDSLTNFVLPPDTIVSIDYPYAPQSSGRLMNLLLPDTTQQNYYHNRLCQCLSTYIWATSPNVELVVRTDTTIYSIYDTVYYQIKGLTNFSGTGILTTVIKNGPIVYQTTIDTLNIDSTHYFQLDRTLYLADTMPFGIYLLNTQLSARGTTWGKSKNFQFQFPSLSMEVYPDSLITDCDTLSHVAQIEPEYVKIKDVRSFFNIIYHSDYPVLIDTILFDSLSLDTLQNLDTIRFVFSIPPEKKKEGAYYFRYRFSYLDRTISGHYSLFNHIYESPSFDKYSYHIGDTVFYSLKMSNPYHFVISGDLTDSFSPAGFYDSLHLTIFPGSETTFTYSIIIPESLSAGSHSVTTRFITPAFSDSVKPSFYIPAPYVLCSTDTSYYRVRDTISVIIYNGGGAIINVNLSAISLWDNNWNCFYQDSARIHIYPNDFGFYKFTVPEVMGGHYYLLINGNVEDYNIPINKRIDLEIDGVGADIALRTSKDIYLPYEEVKPQADCKNGDYQFNGRLDLSIRPYGLYPGDTTFIPGDDLWWIDDWSSPGCTLSNGRLRLLGWNKFYYAGSWSLEPGQGKAGGRNNGQGAKSDPHREILLRILEAKKQGKGRGSEPIRYTAMAEKDGMLYAGLSTDMRRKILGPYPEWNEVYDVSQIASIYQMAMDDNYFYIVDIDSGYVYKVSRGSGNIEKRWRVSNPGGIGVFNNSLYLVDRINHWVLKTTLNGDTILIFGADSLIEPKDLAIDNAGRIYVSDLNKAKVYIFDEQGSCLGTKGTGRFSQIAIGNNGYLYGADMDSLKTVKYDENGNLLEYYWNYPDEIMVCDTLIHLAKIYADYFDYVYTEVLTNYGRNKGYSVTWPAYIPGIKYINEFIPTQSENSGNIDWYFMVGVPAKKIEELVWYPIDSLKFVDLEGYECTPFFKAELSKPDEGTSPEIEKFELSYLTRRSGDIIWQDSVPLSFAPQESVLIEKNAGVFSDSGEFILWGDAYLNNGQHLPSLNTHNFYVQSSLLGLSLRTDRNIYYPGEDVKTTVIAVNNADSIYTDISLQLFKRDMKVLDTLLTSLMPNSACTLSVMLSDLSSFLLTGLLLRHGLDTLMSFKSVDIDTPDVWFWVAFPCSVDHKPFTAQTEVYNWWSREVEVVLRSGCGDSVYLDTFVLWPNESRVIEHLFTITEDETLYTEIIRPIRDIKRYGIRFGEKLEIEIDSVVSSENWISIPYSVINTGEFDCAFKLHMEIGDSMILDSITYHCLLPVGDTLNGEWGANLNYGRYSLHWWAEPESVDIILSEGRTSINVIQPNLVSIESIILEPECDSLGHLTFDIYMKNNSANIFYGNIGLSASFISETEEIELMPFADTSVRFTSDAILSEGYQVMMARVSQNGEMIDEYTDSIDFHSKLLLDEISEGLTFNAGDTAKICITTRNKGTAIGEEDLRIDLGELGEQSTFISIIPGGVRTDTFIFFIPEDMDERTIYGSVWLGDEEYILPVKILGYKVVVSALLNQPNFQEGDTVVLRLNIANQNERNIKGFGTANYNGENIISNFYLAGYAQNIDLSNAETLMAIDTPGVYVGKVLWLDGFDSLMFRPEGSGNYAFWVRMVESDSVHYTGWISDTIVHNSLNYKAIQYRVEFFDTVSYLERIGLRIYNQGGYRDTVIETFEPLDIMQDFAFPFDYNTNILFYGVYTETGRGLWLNTIYVFPANDTCNIITDKQVYRMGDTVFAMVQSPYNGKLTWQADFYPMGVLRDSLWIDSLHNRFQFALPSELTSGTYDIDFNFYIDGDTLKRFSASQPFDVQGYQVVVTECRLDTNEYQPGDSIFIRFKLTSNSRIPVITRIRFVQNYQWYEGLVDTALIDSGFNIIDFGMVVPGLERGPAFLSYAFYKDSLFLTYSSEGFMVYVPDTVPPCAYFIQVPGNTYNPNISHRVKIVATDETAIYDTLYYHNGITLTRMSHHIKKGDTLIYEIPSQPRGTIISYYITLRDSFANITRLPLHDYKQFWVLSPLPPWDCLADTVNQRIVITWQVPGEDLIYHSGYPFNTRIDTIAVRFTPQYLPARLERLGLFAEKTTPDTGLVILSFYSVVDGKPGIELCPSETMKIGESGANWVEKDFDSLSFDDELFILLSGEGIRFYGDGDDHAFRTIIKDGDWRTDTAFGNLLCQARFTYEPESIYYRVMRQDSLQFVVIGDSLMEKEFIDSMVGGEKRYRYLVQAHYTIPDLNGTSPIIAQTYDYTPPVFGDSIVVMEKDTGYVIGCEITDGIGVAKDSIVYDGIAVSHDSVVDDWYWWTIPKDRIYQGNCSGLINQIKMSDKSDRYNKIEILKQVQNDRKNWGKTPLDYEGGVIAYYFIASDSAGNTARNPDTGYFYIIPHIPEGFSGHITKDTTWLTDILIKGDVWVDSGATLTIGPGVKVRFIPHYDAENGGMDSTRAEFIIRGGLTLLGNDSLPVIFTSNGTQPDIGDWYGIRFENLEGAKEIVNTEIKYAEIGVYHQLVVQLKIEGCAINHCHIGVDSKSRATKIMDTRFLGNQQGLLINDGRLNLVTGCTFTSNYTGLRIYGQGVEKGVECNNRYTTTSNLRDGVPSYIEDDKGLEVGERSQFALVFNNTFTDNDTGIIFSDSALGMVHKNEIVNNLIGVYITENSFPILGIKMSGQNKIEARFSDSLSYAVYNNTSNYILAEGNWWGTNNRDSIPLFIWDYFDDSTKGIVDFEPFRIYEFAGKIGGTQESGEKGINDFSFWMPLLCKGNEILISYITPQKKVATIEIYDITGRLARKGNVILEPGNTRQCRIRCDNLARGIYFVILRTDVLCLKRKFILMR